MTALILTGLVLALCCGRDDKLSSLHRHMVNHFEPFCKAIYSQHVVDELVDAIRHHW